MSKRPFIAALLAASTMAAGAQAAALQKYECETKNSARYGWISSKFYLSYDAQAKRGWAYDSMIRSQQKDMREVDFKVRSDTSYQFKWTMEDLKGRDGRVDATYKVTLFTARNAFSVSGHLHGWGNQLAGNGTCKRVP